MTSTTDTTDPGGPGIAPGRRVVVAVLTYRRPDDLRELLLALAEQVVDVRPPARVLVVDNDPEAGARDVVAALGGEGYGGGGGGVRYVHEPAPGIAAGRNRALAEAGDADLLVFIDDDERPVGHWLRDLLEVYRRDRPAAVVGPVVSAFPSEPEPWIAAGRFFDRRQLPTGTEVAIAATNNLLLDLAQLRELGLAFDERFGLSGGSDMLLTRQLTRAGGRIVWCAEAVVTDVVPADRLTRQWVLHRAFRSGNTWARTSVALADGPTARMVVRARAVVEGGVRVGGGGLRMLVGVVGGSLALRAGGRRTIARGSGMLAGAVGVVHVEYARSGRGRVRESRLAAG